MPKITPDKEIAIRTENLGKRYRLGSRQAGYRTLREALIDTLAAPVRAVRRAWQQGGEGGREPGNNTIWALKNISLEVPQGDILGIIGRNGAGKTTLLKVLSRITEPTSGRAVLRGRVGSLLEVGTGFHPELTGRENIFLNGAILGMSRREIQRQFDEIVAFAEMGRFIDTPLKRYSTGMATRLAFAIAAHLDTEILLVDEVLAVGDLGFRQRCLGKMKDVTQEGRTVIFVSHDMNAIRRLCKRAVWLEEGEVRASGEVAEVVASYEASFQGPEGQRAWRVQRAHPPNSTKWFSYVSLTTADGEPTTAFSYGDTLCLTVGMEGNTSHQSHFFEWKINYLSAGMVLAWGGSKATPGGDVPGGCRQVSVFIGPLTLTEGSYSISLNMGVGGIALFDFWHDAIVFEVVKCKSVDSDHHFSTLYAPLYIPYKMKYEA
jgi:lipopolysaccharide transport system ATP-binding protein